ncbi:MAG TPA: gliding motility protein GldM [Bacteroidales bacterium]|nr:gliding motility protein GldM [Bacteroidales bacterium]HOR81318.1 gliding motility protein GldM [Bacteroidales bacterium]HPJ90796.1 gliding motility protein GldM [Bacteroidales bacterium]
MGAKNCPETPRQKMIGMMYLVLTAMLALNVSKDILDAFIIVNDTMEQTNANFTSKVEQSYILFEKALENEKDKVEPFYKKALKVKKESDEMVAYIEQIKKEMFMAVDGLKEEEVKGKSLKDMDARDNYDKPTQYFIGQTGSGKAIELKNKINAYKKNLISIVNSQKYNTIIKEALVTDGDYRNTSGEPETWEQHNFDHIVAAACYTILNKIIGEVRNTEYATVSFLYSDIESGSFKFDNVSARVIPNSRIVFSGDSYEADIIVAAVDSRQNPSIYWGPSRDTVNLSDTSKLTLVEGENGMVRLKIPTGGIGDQRYAGVIKLKTAEGDKFYPFKDAYTVTRPSAAIAAEKMNVLYAGIPNPIGIAAPVAPERMRISWGGLSPRQLGGGKYEVTPDKNLIGKRITISVAADLGTGKTQNMGSQEFRVKGVPNPVAYIGSNIGSGKIAKNLLTANPFLTAKMENFDFELAWRITSYKVTVVKNGREVSSATNAGAQFSESLKNTIRASGSGTTFEFTEIRAQSIAGVKNLENITVRIR